jgi:cytochrome c556
MGSSQDLDTAKADFKAAWENLKARVSKDELAAAYKAFGTTAKGCHPRHCESGEAWET